MRLLQALLTMMALLLLPCDSFARNDLPPHMDPYMRGPANENPLAKEVRFILLALPRYGVFDDVGFNIYGGAVTLVGQVRTARLKDDAGNAVKSIAGVTGVINNIEVLPVSYQDDSLRRAVYRVIYSDPLLTDRYAYLASQRIHIIVKNGAVRLEGSVDSIQDRSLIDVAVAGVAGVSAFENDLGVENK